MLSKRSLGKVIGATAVASMADFEPATAMVAPSRAVVDVDRL